MSIALVLIFTAPIFTLKDYISLLIDDLIHTNFQGTYISWMQQIQYFIFKDHWPDCVSECVSRN